MAVKKEENTKKRCFVIMPFSDPEGYEPGHFRKIYEHIFVPAIETAGYEPLRIDDNSVSNLIHSKMLNELITAPMVLCDLSTNNPNVLYELGIRHAFDQPVVLVHEVGQERIFDIGAITSIEYHPKRLYEDVLDDHKRIAEAIRQTAQAKNKYSIMDLAAIHAAKPASGESVSREDRLEYLIQNISRKMSSLEKRIDDAQNRGVEVRHTRQLNSDSLKQFWDYMEDLEEYLSLYERDIITPTVEEVEMYREKLYDAFQRCEDEVREYERARASNMDRRLMRLKTTLLTDKKKNSTDFVSIIDKTPVD